ncbi:MAG: hemolysin III family protein [Acidimicrobiia bacterium]|nr:hemolysin III family protein [Acidimicrobiia bacterium]MDQ3391554.1 hemolysin III family protein [Actinomycetota bacterium]
MTKLLADIVAAPSLVGERDVPLGCEQRPSWRGRLHAIALIVAAPFLVALTILADGTRARVGVIVYAAGLCTMFGVSATYHRWVHTLRARAMWRRADHAAIYAAIAGSFTPVCLLAVPDRWSASLLTFVWTGALCGATIKLAGWRHANVVGGVLYIGLGWVGAAAIPAVWLRYGVEPAVLLIVGGLLYTGGAVGFAHRWPRRPSAAFSYHEVWHGFTVAAAAAHFAAVWQVAS